MGHSAPRRAAAACTGAAWPLLLRDCSPSPGAAAMCTGPYSARWAHPAHVVCGHRHVKSSGLAQHLALQAGPLSRIVRVQPHHPHLQPRGQHTVVRSPFCQGVMASGPKAERACGAGCQGLAVAGCNRVAGRPASGLHFSNSAIHEGSTERGTTMRCGPCAVQDGRRACWVAASILTGRNTFHVFPSAHS